MGDIHIYDDAKPQLLGREMATAWNCPLSAVFGSFTIILLFLFLGRTSYLDRSSVLLDVLDKVSEKQLQELPNQCSRSASPWKCMEMSHTVLYMFFH